jgi:hypothetical protein
MQCNVPVHLCRGSQRAPTQTRNFERSTIIPSPTIVFFLKEFCNYSTYREIRQPVRTIVQDNSKKMSGCAAGRLQLVRHVSWRKTEAARLCSRAICRRVAECAHPTNGQHAQVHDALQLSVLELVLFRLHMYDMVAIATWHTPHKYGMHENMIYFQRTV